MMTATLLRVASISGAGALLFLPGPEYITFGGVLVTAAASLIAQVLKNRDDSAREERRHQYEVEEREATARVRASIDERLERNLIAVEENTAITLGVAAKADEAAALARQALEREAKP